MAIQYAERAREALGSVPESSAAEALGDAVTYAVDRRR
jgi:geranylgeranyl pyrophosphate synthase